MLGGPIRRQVGLAVTMLALGVLPGCRLRLFQDFRPAIEGSGRVLEEVREVEPFQAIAAHDALVVSYEPGEVATVIVRGDDDLVPLVRALVREGVLVLEMVEDTRYESRTPLEVLVVGPAVSVVEAHGAAQVRAKLDGTGRVRLLADGASQVWVSELGASEAILEVSGAARLEVKGRTDAVTLTAAGASRIDAGALVAAHVEVDVSGAAHVEVYAAGDVRGSASGASVVRLAGGSGRGDGVSTSGAARVVVSAP